MPPHQQHRPGSSRLCQIQLMNSVRFTDGPNSTVPKLLVLARAVTHRGSVQLRTAWLKSCGAQFRDFHNRRKCGIGKALPAAQVAWGG